MNGFSSGAPTCPKCGGLSINPGEAQCRFCGTPLGAQGYGGAPQGYAQPGYGASPPGYGQPPPGYGAPPGYGGAPPGYGGAPQMQQPMQQPYGAPPGYGGQNYGAPQNPYAAPYGQNPYGGPGPGQYPMAPVQGFNGNYGRQVNRGWGFGGGWSTFFWIRLAIAGAFISLSLLGACINAISH